MGASSSRTTSAADKSDRAGAFLRAVEWWRNHLGLGHNAFARRVGLSQAYWCHIRHGKRPLTLRVVELILADRPDLRYALTDDLLARVKGGKTAAPPSPAP